MDPVSCRPDAVCSHERALQAIPLWRLRCSQERGCAVCGRCFNYVFPFQNSTAATLEFWVYTSTTAEQDIFWTTSAVSSGDTNRFNIGLYNGYLFGDYRDPNGALHPVFDGGSVGVALNQWNFIALEKNGNTYTSYVNNVLNTTVTDASPYLPTSTGWTINGRSTMQPYGCVQFSGLLDNVALYSQALTTSQFLNVPEPPVSALSFSLLALLAVTGAVRRRRSVMRFLSLHRAV